MEWFKDLFSLLVDNACRGCGQTLTSQEAWCCFDCLGQIQQTHFHLRLQDNELYYRLAGRVDIAGAAGLFYFDKHGRLQRLVKAFKYHRTPQVAEHLGKVYGNVLRDSDFARQFDAIVPVPLHPAKRRKRGYNQAAKIAQGLGEALEKPIENRCLRRRRNTRTQTRQSREARWQNVAGAFACASPPPRRLLLLDDVITTGATLEACVKALQENDFPPEAIYIGCIGVARSH